jgi:hypothetical protein
LRVPASRWERIICLSILGGILLGISVNVWKANEAHYAYAKEEVFKVPQEVQIRVVVDWTQERIEKEIRDTFSEDSETAIKVARCENGWSEKRGYKADIQSGHVLSYGQEQSFGIFQIHAPDWHKTALRLGYNNYQTDPGDNIKMARYIYDNAGKKWRDWTCYTKKMI